MPVFVPTWYRHVGPRVHTFKSHYTRFRTFQPHPIGLVGDKTYTPHRQQGLLITEELGWAFVIRLASLAGSPRLLLLTTIMGGPPKIEHIAFSKEATLGSSEPLLNIFRHFF